MPKSKRDRKVALSKVTKKVGLNFKQDLIDKIRQAVDQYDRLFVFTVDNMRNNKLKALRDHWRESSKFFLGKNRVMSVALGNFFLIKKVNKLFSAVGPHNSGKWHRLYVKTNLVMIPQCTNHILNLNY